MPSSSEEQLERLLAEAEFSSEQLFSVLNSRGMLEGIFGCLSDQVLMDIDVACLEKLSRKLSAVLERRGGSLKRLLIICLCFFLFLRILLVIFPWFPDAYLSVIRRFSGST